MPVPADDAGRTAFWVNAYNETLRRLVAERPMRPSVLLDLRRFGRPAPPASFTERNRNFYPYPQQERVNNPNTPADPAI